MKIAQLAYALTVMVVALGCARAPEASAPAASATSPASANYGAPPPAEAAPIAAPASPAPAAAPQGLDDASPTRKGAPLDQEFATLEAAERALNQAKADLDRLALAEPAKQLGRSAASGGASEKKDRAAEPPKASAAGSTAPSALCENACRAFSSLSRAANAVCRLDGNGGSHCTRAKRVLADSQLRVASCSCSVAD